MNEKPFFDFDENGDCVFPSDNAWKALFILSLMFPNNVADEIKKEHEYE